MKVDCTWGRGEPRAARAVAGQFVGRVEGCIKSVKCKRVCFCVSTYLNRVLNMPFPPISVPSCLPAL